MSVLCFIIYSLKNEATSTVNFIRNPELHLQWLWTVRATRVLLGQHVCSGLYRFISKWLITRVTGLLRGELWVLQKQNKLPGRRTSSKTCSQIVVVSAWCTVRNKCQGQEELGVRGEVGKLNRWIGASTGGQRQCLWARKGWSEPVQQVPSFVRSSRGRRGVVR